jgi:hypothetical protein
MPTATPNETEYINRDFLKAPLVRFCTVMPKAFNAGSARVEPKPRKKAKPSAMSKPKLYQYNGEPGTASIVAKAAGTKLPD